MAVTEEGGGLGSGLHCIIFINLCFLWLLSRKLRKETEQGWKEGAQSSRRQKMTVLAPGSWVVETGGGKQGIGRHFEGRTYKIAGDFNVEGERILYS